MSSSGVAPLVSRSSRVGPVFCTKDQCVFVKVSKEDKKRAVINTTSMTLVEYAERCEYPQGPPRSDQSLFVPIFCKECYGTTEDDYAEALASIVSCGSDKYLVGMCCVFGLAQGEAYPESRKDFTVGNDMSYSGACHPQPGKAVFQHKDQTDIGRVKCYWHVHSRSVDKTFLYCCVACNDNEYTNGVLKPEMSTAFSLGTVGDNTSGPVTMECSLVTVPMRSGCFCTLVTGKKDLTQTMTRMGFSTLKDSALDAGVTLKESSEAVNAQQTKSPSDASGDGDEEQSIAEIVKHLRKAVLDQAAEMRLLKDILEAIKVQNSVLTQSLKCPDDSDTLFTVQGAKDFTRRTGVKTKLCAGIKTTDQHTNAAVTDPTGETPSRNPEQMEGTTGASQPQIDHLLNLLQSQQQPQPQPQQQLQAQALQSFIQLAPILQHLIQPQTQHLQNPQRQTGQGMYHPSGTSNPGDRLMQYGTLTEEQRKKIAMEYIKEESERKEALQKEQEKMLDSIKAGVRDVILEQQRSSASQESSSNLSSTDTLQTLACDIPYKRARKPARDDYNPGDISKLMSELRELTKQIKQGGSSSSAGSCEAVATDKEHTEETSALSALQSNTAVTNKQQAGYSVPSGGNGSHKTSTYMEDFISAVVTKI